MAHLYRVDPYAPPAPRSEARAAPPRTMGFSTHWPLTRGISRWGGSRPPLSPIPAAGESTRPVPGFIVRYLASLAPSRPAASGQGGGTVE